MRERVLGPALQQTPVHLRFDRRGLRFDQTGDVSPARMRQETFDRLTGGEQGFEGS